MRFSLRTVMVAAVAGPPMLAAWLLTARLDGGRETTAGNVIQLAACGIAFAGSFLLFVVIASGVANALKSRGLLNP